MGTTALIGIAAMLAWTFAAAAFGARLGGWHRAREEALKLALPVVAFDGLVLAVGAVLCRFAGEWLILPALMAGAAAIFAANSRWFLRVRGERISRAYRKRQARIFGVLTQPLLLPSVIFLPAQMLSQHGVFVLIFIQLAMLGGIAAYLAKRAQDRDQPPPPLKRRMRR
jgi:hypothetical protein